ncbi:hypothetical protein SODG_004077 [Sodalis praecaptivus]
MRYPVALLCHVVSLDGCVVWQSGLRRCPAVLQRQTAPRRIPRHAFSLGGVPDFYGGRQRLGGSLDMFSPSAASVVFTAACCAPPTLPTLRYAAGSPDRVRGPSLDFIFSRRGRFSAAIKAGAGVATVLFNAAPRHARPRSCGANLSFFCHLFQRP